MTAHPPASHPPASRPGAHRLGRRRSLLVAALAAVALLAVGCGASAAPQDPVTVSEGPATVAVADDVFSPNDLIVPVGTTVTWTWEGERDHNVVADAFSSDVQSTGTFSHTFDEPGTYEYRCTLHGGMDGTVTVE